MTGVTNVEEVLRTSSTVGVWLLRADKKIEKITK